MGELRLGTEEGVAPRGSALPHVLSIGCRLAPAYFWQTHPRLH